MADAYESLGDVVSTAPQGADPYAALGDVQGAPSGRPANFDGVYFKDLGEVAELQKTYAPDSPEAKMAPEDFAAHYGQTRSTPQAVMIGDKVLQAPKSMGDQLVDATKNTVAGIAQGITAIPDAATHFVAGLGQLGAKAVSGAGSLANDAAPGYGDALVNAGNFADQNLAKPITLGGMVEAASPTPDDTTGKVARVASQLAGGAISVPGMTTVPNALMPKAPPSTNYFGSNVARAAQAENVPISRPYVSPGVRNDVTALETTPGGSNIVRPSLSNTSNALSAGVDRLAGTGDALHPDIAGGKIQDAGRTYIAATRAKSRSLYDAAKSLGGSEPVNPSQAMGELDTHIAELSRGPKSNSALIHYLQDLKSDLSPPADVKTGILDATGKPITRPGQGLTIDSLRNIRTQMRGQINVRNLTATDAERRVGLVLDKASKDIEASLSGNKAALKAYQKADTFYRQRQAFIKDVVQKFIGRSDIPTSPEKTFAKFQAMATPKGDAARMKAMMDKLSPEDRADIVATFAHDLGKNADGVFSPALLVSQAAKLSPAAKANLFGEAGRASLGRLVTVAREHAAIVKNLNNSRSAVGINYRSLLPSILGVGGGVGALFEHGLTTASMVGLGTAGLAKAANYAGDHVSARLLMNPDVSKWIATAPATVRKASMAAHIGRLTAIATNNPSIAPEVQGLQQRLMGAVNDNLPKAGQAAASPDQGPEQQQNANAPLPTRSIAQP